MILLRLCSRFSKIPIMDGIKTDIQGMENISELPFYRSFKQGTDLSINGKYEEANTYYQQALNQLEDKK